MSRQLGRRLLAIAVAAGLLLGLGPVSLVAPGTADAAVFADVGATETDQPDEQVSNLYEQRLAWMSRRSTAVQVHIGTTEAIAEKEHQELLARNGYEPGTTDPREIARQIMLNWYGWGDTQFGCYDRIITQESRWRWWADNPHSSAYGIPQALPGKKMASEGADWKTNPATQIKWGLKYVKQRYGTPCSAWSFKRSHGWY